MFKRIKNLLDLSKYEVSQENELVAPKVRRNPQVKTKKRLATIVDMDADPLKDFDVIDDFDANPN